MADGLGVAESLNPGEEPLASPVSSPGESLFQRRMEFHPARKPFSAIPSSGRTFHMETLNPSSSSHRPALSSRLSMAASSPGTSGKRFDDGEFSEHGFDPEISFQITFRRIGAGLANLGNTCFLNSVLQCLTYTEPFAAYLQSGRHKSACRTAGFCAMCALQNHVMIALKSTGKILSPLHLVKNLRSVSRNFRNSRQEDAHEYMVNLLESMHKCCLPSGVPSESPSAYEKSLVHKIFGGHLRSQVKCTQCSYRSNKFDPFLDLSLEISKADSLHKALSHFTAVEQLDGGEKQYQCQRCKQKVRALKQLTVHKAPYVLTIHLKRFGSDAPGQKIDKRVQFCPTLDFKPFVSDPHEGDLKYTLYGVLVHAGWSTHSGHYYCFIRTSSGMWYTLDDNRVFQVSEKTVFEQKAYMLFYFRNRKSSAPKRHLDADRRANNSANVPVNKGPPASSSVLKDVNQVCLKEKLSSTSEHASVISKADVTSNGKVFAAESILPVAPPLKDTILQENDQVLLTKGSVLQTNGHVGSELRQFTPSNPTLDTSSRNRILNAPNAQGHQMEAEGLAESALTEYSVSQSVPESALSKDNGVVTNSHHDGSSVLSVNAQSSSGSGCLPRDSNVQEAVSFIRGTEQNKSNGFRIPAPEMLLGETNLCEKGNALDEKGLRNDTSCKMVRALTSQKLGQVKLSCQSSSALDGCIKKEALSATQAEHQDSVMNGMKLNDLPHSKAGGSVVNFEEIGQANLCSQHVIANECVRKEVHAKAHKGCSSVNRHRIKLKKNKLSKLSMALGPRHLFFASLYVLEKKKHKRSKKRCLKIKSEVADSILVDQDTSKSEIFSMIDGGAKQSPKQQFSVNSVEENGFCEEKGVNYGNVGSLNHKGRVEAVRRGKNTAVLAANGQYEPCLTSAAAQFDVRETNACSMFSTQHGFMNILTRGLDNTKVAKWDDIQLPSIQTHRSNDEASSSIGYVLDEWAEEYDRGKKKKVKKSHRSFGGPNLFREIASIKAQRKRKMDRTSSQNQPIRI